MTPHQPWLHQHPPGPDRGGRAPGPLLPAPVLQGTGGEGAGASAVSGRPQLPGTVRR